MNTIVELNPELTLSILTPNDLPGMWADLEPLLIEACEHSNGESNVQSVVDGVFAGAYQMLVFMRGHVPESVLLLTISQFPTGKKILEIVLASGKGLKSWIHFEPQLLGIAKQYGCTSVRMIGREGIQRMLPEWKRAAVVLERSI